jgi:hypothetical protein
MISLLHDCNIYVDNGSMCGDNCCWNAWWESEKFSVGEEIDESDPTIDISDLTEGEDFVRL